MNIKLKYFLVSILFTFVTSVNAQSRNEVDVTLRSGTIYHGVIYEEMRDSIRLLTEEDHILQIARSEIFSIEKKPNRRSEWIRVQDSKSKYYFTTNFLSQVNWLDELAFGVEAFGGIKHNKHWQSGVGVGIHRDIGLVNYQRFFGQISLQNRLNFRPYGSSPFISYEPKVILPFRVYETDEIKYKPFAHSLEIGYRFYSSKKNRSFNLSIAVQQHTGRIIALRYNWSTNSYKLEPYEWHKVYNAHLKVGFQI